MKDIFYISFTRRDFSGPVMPVVDLEPERLTWSAFGGADWALINARGPVQNLLELASLLRCGVEVVDQQSTPVWWGFVDEVTIFLARVQVRVTLDNFFNQVRVRYSFISPDNKLADQLETSSAANAQSQREFGVKETVLYRTDLDEDFAESLRDTFLSLHAWPTSELSQRAEPGQVHAELHCSGWFKTLAWQSYQNLDGFYANYGPGPGVFAFGDSVNHRYAGQSFTPGVNCDLKYAYFRIRKEGSPATNLTARLHQDSGGYPQSVIATSETVSAASISREGYEWMKFTWSTPYTLTGGQRYWISLNPGGVNAANYYILKIDENMNLVGQGGKYYDQSASTWNKLPSITAPGSRPDVYFRVVCLSDTGEQLAAIAGEGGQFLTKITSLTTGVMASAYRNNGHDCYEEILSLMRLGTSNQRLVLAGVTPGRHLQFYEQPDPEEADLYMDGESRFFTKTCAPFPSYHPPVGRWVRLAAVTDIRLPWDRNRLPACFIAGAAYFPRDRRVVVKAV